jgi:hypothetical protein
MMDADAYLADRLQPEIAWYDKKSGRNKFANAVTKIIEITCAAAIPLLAGYAKGGEQAISVIIGTLGVVVAISTGVSSLLKGAHLGGGVLARGMIGGERVAFLGPIRQHLNHGLAGQKRLQPDALVVIPAQAGIQKLTDTLLDARFGLAFLGEPKRA